MAERFSVDELSRRAGMTVSNVRSMQRRGILAPPLLEGRKGVYTERHLARLALVRRLQERGFSLAAIQDQLRAWESGAGLMQVMGFEDTLAFSSDAVSEVSVAEVYPELLEDRQALARALDLGVVERRGADVVAPNAELLGLIRDNCRAGVPRAAMLAEVAALRAESERVAARARKMFDRYVVQQLDPAMPPAVQLDVLGRKVAEMRPAAIRIATLILTQAFERGGPLAPRFPDRGARSKSKSKRRSP